MEAPPKSNGERDILTDRRRDPHDPLELWKIVGRLRYQFLRSAAAFR